MPRHPDIDKKDRYYDPFPSALRKLKKTHHKTQEDLKAVLRLQTRQSVTAYEDGSIIPTADKIIAVAQYFGVSADYLLGLNPNPSVKGNCREAAEYTGLSENAIEILHNMKPFVEGSYWQSNMLADLIENPNFGRLIMSFLEIKKLSETNRRLMKDPVNVDIDVLIENSNALGYEIYSATKILEEIIDELYGTRELLKSAREIKEAF